VGMRVDILMKVVGTLRRKIRLNTQELVARGH